MTIKAIKEMFKSGVRWSCRRQGPGFMINGNGVRTFVPDSDVTDTRTVFTAKSQLVWTRDQGNKLYTEWPKATEVIEAAPGHLKFRYNNGVVCTFSILA